MSEETRFYNALQSIINDEDQTVKQLEEVRELYHRGDASVELKRYHSYDKEKAYLVFQKRTRKKSRNKVIRLSWSIAAAAAILVGIIIPFIGQQDMPAPSPISQQSAIPALSDSLPRIKLASGEIIEIPDTCNSINVQGVKATINNSTLQLSGISDNSSAVQMNEIIIPRGRQYRITLEDGTAVLMNSESSLRFPNRFTNSREIELKGQAFFDVTKDGRPFRVTCPTGTVTVLGTSFDIRSYEGESTLVTLVKGKVKFADASAEVTLKPGEQVCQSEEGLKVYVVDTHRFTAWKDGLIYFDDNLESVMRNIERIYDVKVIYSNEGYKQIRFIGECSRFQTIDEFMKLLSLTQEFNYEINGNIVKIE